MKVKYSLQFSLSLIDVLQFCIVLYKYNKCCFLTLQMMGPDLRVRCAKMLGLLFQGVKFETL